MHTTVAQQIKNHQMGHEKERDATDQLDAVNLRGDQAVSRGNQQQQKCPSPE